MHYRAVFISDLHLGTPGCQADALLDFLKSHSSDHLYLVGDIIDGWQLRRKWYWPQAHNDVVQKILRRVRKGCHVVYVPGNHDEFARDFVDHHFGGIEVVEEASLTLCWMDVNFGWCMATISMRSSNTPNGWLTLATPCMKWPCA